LTPDSIEIAILTTHMNPRVTIETVTPRKLAAVRRRVLIGEVASAWRPALDKVWEFLRQNPGLRTDGHNIFVYHHPPDRQLPMDVEFGVEVVRSFDSTGEVVLLETPAGKVATALHVGPYDQMNKTHEAIHAWAAANGSSFAGTSWEIYGDWTDDVSKQETRIEYLLS
jgi:effector-binding domain-containing protein